MDGCYSLVEPLCRSHQEIARAILNGDCRKCGHRENIKRDLIRSNGNGVVETRVWCLPAKIFHQALSLKEELVEYCPVTQKILSIYLHLWRLAMGQCADVGECPRKLVLFLRKIAQGETVARRDKSPEKSVSFRVIGDGDNNGDLSRYIKNLAEPDILLNPGQLYEPGDLDF